MRGDWRKYSDEQWMRLAGASGIPDGNSPTNRDSYSKSRVALIRFAPLLLFAAFLAGHAVIGRSRARVAGTEENQMRFVTTTLAATLATAVATAAIGSAVHAQELFQNGSFEGGVSFVACGWDNPTTGSTMIPGWVVTGPFNVDWVVIDPSTTSCPCSHGGSRYIDLNGSLTTTAPASAIAQTVATTAGKRYQLSVFAMANSSYTSIGTIKQLRVSAGQDVTEFDLVTFENCVGCPCANWQQMTMTFVATASATDIEFRSLFPNNAGGIFIDSASIRPVICAGDVDDSSWVDVTDLAIVLQNWGVPSAKQPRSDITLDGAVDGNDLAILLSNWGACP